MSEIDRYAARELFCLEEGVSYFGCASIAPLLRSVRAAGERALERWSRPWELDQEMWYDDADAVRGLVASMLNVTPDDMAIVPSVSYGMEIAARNLPIERGKKILTLDRQFPSNVYPWRRIAAERGAEVATVPAPKDGDWTSAVIEMIDAKTSAVSVPNVHWSDGAVLDLVRVGEACRASGSRLVLDLTQSAGVIPTDLNAIGADFVVASGYKWLLGPYGVAHLYVAPEWQAGEPLEVNWMARANSARFDLLSDYTDDYHAGARRFDAGEHTNYVLLPMTRAALEQVSAWGAEGLSRTLGSITDSIQERATSCGWRASAGSFRSPHIVGLAHERADVVAVARSMSAAGVKASVRDGRLRVAGHLHIGDEDLDRFERSLAAATSD